MQAAKPERSRRTILGADGEIQDLEQLLGTANAPDESLDRAPVYCIHCGTANPAQANFCARCGQIITDPDQFASVSKRKRATQPIAASRPEPAAEKQNSVGKPIWVGLSRAIMVLLVAAQSLQLFGLWMFGNSGLLAIPLIGAAWWVNRRRRKFYKPLSEIAHVLKFGIEVAGIILLINSFWRAIRFGEAGTQLALILAWALADALVQYIFNRIDLDPLFQNIRERLP